MSDIVEDLGYHALFDSPAVDVDQEDIRERAIAEIESLRAEVAKFRSALERFAPDILDELEADDE